MHIHVWSRMVRNDSLSAWIACWDVLMHKLVMWMSMDSGFQACPCHSACTSGRKTQNTGHQNGLKSRPSAHMADTQYWIRQPSASGLKTWCLQQIDSKMKRKGNCTSEHLGTAQWTLLASACSIWATREQNGWRNEIKCDCVSPKVRTEPSLPPNITIGSQANSKASPDLWHVMLMRHNLIWLVDLTSNYK